MKPGCRAWSSGRKAHYESLGAGWVREAKAGPAAIEAAIKAAFEAKTTWERGAIESLSSDMFRIGG